MSATVIKGHEKSGGEAHPRTSWDAAAAQGRRSQRWPLSAAGSATQCYPATRYSRCVTPPVWLTLVSSSSVRSGS